MMRALPLPIALTTLLLMVVPVASSEQSAAVFDFELIDTSLEGEMNGPRADEQARVGRLGEELRKRLAASGRFVVVDIGPVAREAHASNLQACGGCDVQFAKRLGAALAITGTVQKVSNLILNMNVYIRSADTGRLVAAASVDMRGNTDESWMRGLDWLIRNRLLAVDD
jgi:Protein of unknown function (DUF2380)